MTASQGEHHSIFTNKQEREEEALSSESTPDKSLGKIGLLTPIKVSQRALFTSFNLGCMSRNRQHLSRFFFSPTVMYFRLLFEQPALCYPESRDLIEITTRHLPGAESNLLESHRDYSSHVLIPDFRARMLRPVSIVARNVGLLVSGLLLLDHHVTILGHCRMKQPVLLWHWTKQLLEIWARY